jgi:hypothetical protein
VTGELGTAPTLSSCTRSAPQFLQEFQTVLGSFHSAPFINSSPLRQMVRSESEEHQAFLSTLGVFMKYPYLRV